MKKFFAALLSLAMLAAMCGAYAVEAPTAPTGPKKQTEAAPAPSESEAADPAGEVWPVTLRVEGAKQNLLNTRVSVSDEQMTVIQLVESALEEAGIDCAVTDGSYGKYISSIAGEAEGAFGGYDGWNYFVNGESPVVSMGECTLAGVEEILLVYGDLDQLTPIVEVSRKDGLAVLTVTADVTTYDESWNATVTREPVAGAAVTADGAEYITDAQGQVTLSKESSEKSSVTLQIEKYSEAGLPQVVRQAPGFELALPGAQEKAPVSFPDVPEGKWFTPYVTEMARIGAVKGDPSGNFRPMGQVTRAEAVSVLYNLDGQQAEAEVPFPDVTEGKWFYDAVQWAVANELINPSEANFGPNQPITRQELAVLLVRYQEKVVGAPMSQEGEAPAFADNDQIAAYAAPSIYALQKAGIVSGSGGKFNPAGTATRAELCKMLSGLLAFRPAAQ